MANPLRTRAPRPTSTDALRAARALVEWWRDACAYSLGRSAGERAGLLESLLTLEEAMPGRGKRGGK